MIQRVTRTHQRLRLGLRISSTERQNDNFIKSP